MVVCVCAHTQWAVQLLQIIMDFADAQNAQPDNLLKLSDQSAVSSQGIWPLTSQIESLYPSRQLRQQSEDSWDRTSQDQDEGRLTAYLRQVGRVPDPVHHLLALGVHRRHVGPHPLPGHALDGEPSPVDVEEDPSVLVLLLPRGPEKVVGCGGTRVLLGATAQETVGAAALGAAVAAQPGRGGPGQAGGVRSRHWFRQKEMLVW